MILNLAHELGKVLPPPRAIGGSGGSGMAARAASAIVVASRASAAVVDCRPILQLNALPVTLTPGAYANAHSNVNPGGSYTTLYAFSQLADTVPQFAEYFSPSLNTVSSIYGSLLSGAAAGADQGYVEQVIASAQRNFDAAALSNMDGTPGTWHPAYAAPADWYDTSDPGRFSDITIDLGGGAGMASGPYQTLKPAGVATPSASAGGGSAAALPVDADAALQSVTFKYLEVAIDRCWLDFQIFNLGGWSVQGLQPGYFSSGSTDGNDGALPLITTSMLVAIDVQVAARWSAQDRQVLDIARREGRKVAVGPFVLNGDGGQLGDLHLIGWVSRLVPLAPRIG